MTTAFPIEAIKKDFLSAVSEHALVILSAPTGAGKSTVLPLWLLESEYCQAGKKVYLLQPRRIAAKNIACYLAQQLGEPVGETVGYRLRNEHKVSRNTKLEVITEGILVKLMHNDPEMLNTSLIVFDEFHERSLQADIAFAIARDIQQGFRDDLTLLLMSATLAVEHLQAALPDAHVLCSQGRTFPIDIHYQAPKRVTAWRDHCLQVLKRQLNNISSSVLVFLPSSRDIRWLSAQLSDVLPKHVQLFSLYGDLPLKEQQAAIRPCESGQFKLVLATNIAETSLTIEGIHCVIDSGLENVAVFDDNTLTNQLKQQFITKASAMQRAGRAGRLAAGQCIRLYSEEDFQRRPMQAKIAIEQADLMPVLIEAASWGVTQLSDLPMLTLPAKVKEVQAWHALAALKIVDHKAKLTDFGEKAVKFSCHPRFGNMISRAGVLETPNHVSASALISLACLLTALLEERDLVSSSEAQHDVDILTRLALFLSPNSSSHLVMNIKKHAQQLAKQAKVSFQTQLPLEYAAILLAIAYPERIAKSRKNNQQEYLTVSGKGMVLSNDDKLIASDYLVIANASQQNNSTRIRLALSVDIDALIAQKIVEPSWQSSLVLDPQTEKISALKRYAIGEISLQEKHDKDTFSGDEIAQLWCQEITKNGLSYLNWQVESSALLSRIRWAEKYLPSLNLGDYSEPTLLSRLSLWLSPYLIDIRSKAQLKKLNLSEILFASLSYEKQQLLAKHAPSVYVSPLGRRCKIEYDIEQQSPIIALPMQELYGESQSPCIGDALSPQAIPLTLSLLSPAGRPIQVTQDLAAFWAGSYLEVQKEMKGRYPKHYWPDDPANAKATNKTKKYMAS